MLKSAGRRFLVVSFLVLLMFVPLFFAAEVINSRKSYSESTIHRVSLEWGGPLLVSGPQLVIPVETEFTRLARRPKTDPETGVVLVDAETGEEIMERFEETGLKRTKPVFLYPDRFDVMIDTQTEERRRGIFRVPVYAARLNAVFDFDPEAATGLLQSGERLLWEQAEVRLRVSANKALRGVARLRADDADLALEPIAPNLGLSGLQAATGDPRGHGSYALELGLNGAQELKLAPVGRQSTVEVTSDWPHPSFEGAFLPDSSEITEAGFVATWSIPHLARSLPQASREDPDGHARSRTNFGVLYVTPNDFYHMAYRAARYGILFIALTFLTILLIERVPAKGAEARPAHPVQYILAGLVQTVFVLLMVSYAEHLGFALAYGISSAAVIGLLTLFGVVGLKLGARAWVLGAMLVVVYAVLYLILQSEDYALLAGSTLAFLALALTMIATRNEDWYGAQLSQGPGMLQRAVSAVTAAPTGGGAGRLGNPAASSAAETGLETGQRTGPPDSRYDSGPDARPESRPAADQESDPNGGSGKPTP